MLTASDIIRILDLKPLPQEGGFYKEIYRADESIGKDCLPARYSGKRTFCTTIYYLLTPEVNSAMHRLPSDELFHFYLGDPVTMINLYPDGSGKMITIGPDISAGESLFVNVPKGVWQGCFLKEGGRFALLGVTVSPGFEFEDYENGNRDKLINEYPQFRETIQKLTERTEHDD
jgi:predicted cupin superfamily sugar epimerase